MDYTIGSLLRLRHLVFSPGLAPPSWIGTLALAIRLIALFAMSCLNLGLSSVLDLLDPSSQLLLVQLPLFFLQFFSKLLKFIFLHQFTEVLCNMATASSSSSGSSSKP